MNCPKCKSGDVCHRKARTKRNLQQYKCRDCGKYYNEKSMTAYNYTQYPIDVIIMTVFFYYRYKLSLVDVTELMALRGVSVSHETVRQWGIRFGADIGVKFRIRRWNKVGNKWHMDITYLKVQGYNVYLYRAIDSNGNLIDVYLSDKRDKSSARRFFTQCAHTTHTIPKQITTDKEPGFKDAIHKSLGETVKHRDIKYMNNKIEQSHRGIKAWCRPMKGFKSMWSAMVSCHVFEEIQQFFKTKMPTSKRRSFVSSKFQEMLSLA